MAINIYHLFENSNGLVVEPDEAVEAGQFLKPVTSNEATDTSDPTASSVILVGICDGDSSDSKLVCGVAMTDVDTSDTDNRVTSLDEGVFLFLVDTSNGAVVAGNSLIVAPAADSANAIAIQDSALTTMIRPVGIAMSPANTTGEYCIVKLNIGGGR